MINNQKEIVVKPLKTIHDFAELLSLSDLKVQMGVLGFLQQNLQDYQMNFFKSQLMDWETLVEYISDKDKPTFFKTREYNSGEYDSVKREYITEGYYAEYDWEYAKKEYTDKNYTEDKTNKQYSIAERKFFIVDHKRKKLYTINKKLIDKFTFTYDGKYLVCNYLDIRKDISFERFARCRMHDRHHKITVWFNLDENCVEEFSGNTTYENSGDCGSWYDTANEKFSKNFVDDEDEPWIKEAKLKKKSTETSYKSDDYGDFIIKKDEKNWIITWDCDEDEEYITISRINDLNDYVQDDNEWEKVTKSFPKKGKFKTKEDAYNFIVSIFGKIDEE